MDDATPIGINEEGSKKEEGPKKVTRRRTVSKKQPTIKQMAKSKSNEFNVVIAPAIVGILTAFGVTVPVPVIIAGYAIVNFFLRRYTTTSLNKK